MCFKKFCKADGSLEDEECSGHPSEGDHGQLRAIIKADPLTTTWEVAEEFSVSHSTAIPHLKQIWEVKKLDKWVPRELAKNQNIVVLKCHLLLFYATTMNHFLIRLWHTVKSRFYTTTGDDREEAWKHFPKPNLHLEKVKVTCGLLPVWSTTAFWIPAEPLHLRGMLRKSMRRTENCQHLQPALANREGPILLQDDTDHTSHRHCFKSWTNWATKFCLICRIHLTSHNQQPLLQVSGQFFAEKTLPQPAEGRKCFPRVVRILKRGLLCFRNTPTYFSLAKCVDGYGSCLINNDVFEPTYKDLKFMIWNCDYICTNLIAYLLYPFICWLTFELFPCLGYCK